MRRRALTVALLLALAGLVAAQTPSAPRPAPPAAAPVAKDPSRPLLRFAAYGDTRDGHDVHRAIVAGVMSKEPALVLQTGDLVADSSIASEWKIFDEITAKMRAAIAYYPTRGNHDNQGGELFRGYLPTVGVHRESFHYSFDVGRVHFVAIDTEDNLVLDGAQYLWIDADMKEAVAAGQFIIAFYHKATYSVGPHAAQHDVWEIRPVLHDLFRKYGVRLAFQGHDHIYYRSIRDGVTYVVTGGGGAPLYGLPHPELGIPGDVSESVHHFCIADVFADRVEVTAYRQDMTVLDSFTVAIPHG